MSHTRALLSILVLLWLAGPAHTGELTGKLTPPERVKDLKACDRSKKTTVSAKVDPKTGAFTFQNLPPGNYDIILETTVGRIEGVNLKLPETARPKPILLTPGPMDRADLADLVGLLKQSAQENLPAGQADRKLPQLIGVRLSMSLRKITAVHFRPSNAELPEISTKLSKEMLAHATEVLTGTVVLFEVRNDLPAQADVFIDLDQDKVSKLRITPAQGGLPDQDRKWIIDWVDKVKMFENKKRVLFATGNDRLAKVLVEKIRDQATTLRVPEPTVFWRVEIWDFRKLHGGWEKTDYDVQQRHKMVLREFRKLNWSFEPLLGGFSVTNRGRTVVSPYAIPDKLSPDHGRTPY